MQPFVVSDHSAASCTTRQFAHGAWSIPAHGALQRNTGTSAIFCPLLLKKQTFIYFYCVFQLFLKLHVRKPPTNSKGVFLFESFNERVGTLTPASAKETSEPSELFQAFFHALVPWVVGESSFESIASVCRCFSHRLILWWYEIYTPCFQATELFDAVHLWWNGVNKYSDSHRKYFIVQL